MEQGDDTSPTPHALAILTLNSLEQKRTKLDKDLIRMGYIMSLKNAWSRKSIETDINQYKRETFTMLNEVMRKKEESKRVEEEIKRVREEMMLRAEMKVREEGVEERKEAVGERKKAVGGSQKGVFVRLQIRFRKQCRRSTRQSSD